MTRRTATFSALIAGLLLPVAVEAAPRLNGTYTVSGIEACQAVAGSDRGHIDMRLLKAVVTATTITVSGGSFGGSLFATTPDVGYDVKSGPLPYTLTGTANPYTLTFGSGASARSWPINLQQIDALNIAHRAQTLETDTNGAGKVTCTRSFVLQHH